MIIIIVLVRLTVRTNADLAKRSVSVLVQRSATRPAGPKTIMFVSVLNKVLETVEGGKLPLTSVFVPHKTLHAVLLHGNVFVSVN